MFVYIVVPRSNVYTGNLFIIPAVMFQDQLWESSITPVHEYSSTFDGQDKASKSWFTPSSEPHEAMVVLAMS